VSHEEQIAIASRAFYWRIDAKRIASDASRDLATRGFRVKSVSANDWRVATTGVTVRHCSLRNADTPMLRSYRRNRDSISCCKHIAWQLYHTALRSRQVAQLSRLNGQSGSARQLQRFDSLESSPIISISQSAWSISVTHNRDINSHVQTREKPVEIPLPK